jgi:hypothetical protein
MAECCAVDTVLALSGKAYRANRQHPEMTRATFSHLAVESKPFAPAKPAAIPHVYTIDNRLHFI